MKTFATLFSGGELAGVGMRQAGLTHLWGIEIDDKIANVARANGFHTITADILTVDPHTLPVVDCLHASPVCTRASNANHSAERNAEGTKESLLDIAMGEKVAHFIDVLQPGVITIENVYQYRTFKAFKIILAALNRGGYMWDYDNINAANFGVPQTRRRLILRAAKGRLLPNLPQPERWVSWYEAIEDLIHTLPASKFADWQLARLPKELLDSLLVDSAGYPDSTGARVAVQRTSKEPANTIVSNFDRRQMKAFLVECRNVGNWGSVAKLRNDPAMTITTDHRPSHTPHAWLSTGHVVSMTVQALARFQSMPDSYILPDDNKLTCTIIGNGVPCLMMQKIYKGLTE
jgi:DNA (cytosine-5)-methyltransferase 1